MPNDDHVPVLLDEAVAALALKPDGVYLDATFGRGGHSRRILERLGCGGRLYALDRDPEAARIASGWSDPRFKFRHAWFSEIREVLADDGTDRLDGALFDLGVSSPQIDDAERGFSFRADGPLDMRMDPTRGSSAAEWIAAVDASELARIIRIYGEERFAQQIARAIVATRASEPITRTRQLAAIVAQAIGARPRSDRGQDPATRTFQALRIFLNHELEELSLALEGVVALLNPGGRIAVISFHSLEDRIVKTFFREQSLPFAGDARLARAPIAERDLPRPCLERVGRAIVASPAEVGRNARARSAHLRVAERTYGTGH